MPTLQEQISVIVGRTGSNLGAMAGALRERMYEANAAGKYEKAKAADALYQDYTYEAMRLGRLQISAIDQSTEMKAALTAIKTVNKELADEKKRVANLKNTIDKAVKLIGKVGKAIDKVSKLIS